MKQKYTYYVCKKCRKSIRKDVKKQHLNSRQHLLNCTKINDMITSNILEIM